jgi:anti-sigma-K factor RskA
MSGQDPRTEAHDCGGDPAAYVLGALEPDEADAFRAHLTSCVVCRDEVTAFQKVVDALPAGVPQYRAPKDLRRRVIGAVRAEPRAAPVGPRARWRWSGWLSSGSLVPRPALAAVAALVVALAAVGVLELGSGGSTSSRVLQANVVGSPGTAEIRLSGAHAELIVHRLAPPAPGRIYEVWLKRGNAAPAPSGTLFSVTSGGAGDVGVAGNLRGVSEVLVTSERAGGSLVPTRAPVIVARLT